MFGLGIWEIVVIAVTALVVLGPEKLPPLARQLARMLGELRRMCDEVRHNFDAVMHESSPSPPTPKTDVESQVKADAKTHPQGKTVAPQALDVDCIAAPSGGPHRHAQDAKGDL